YSIVTFATVGYGDVLPISPAARLMAGFEIVLGMIINVVFIAILFVFISNYQAFYRRKEEAKLEKEEEEIKEEEKKIEAQEARIEKKEAEIEKVIRTERKGNKDKIDRIDEALKRIR
ncbi:MAG: potassium channel family protein, partial [Nanoarchaeota archaeon]|nr:potassium channel family protein [Nanoarchaeota archaeon]